MDDVFGLERSRLRIFFESWPRLVRASKNRAWKKRTLDSRDLKYTLPETHRREALKNRSKRPKRKGSSEPTSLIFRGFYSLASFQGEKPTLGKGWKRRSILISVFGRDMFDGNLRLAPPMPPPQEIRPIMAYQGVINHHCPLIIT